MSTPAGFLEFFTLEAGDYVEQLDGVLLRSGATGPDGASLLRAARALRGTATMAKLPTFADVAASIERVGRALQDGVLRWDPALGGALVAAVDDLKILLRGARQWSSSDDDRASTRAAELAKYAPVRTGTSPKSQTPNATLPSSTAHLATEASNIAAGLELLATRAGDPETAANVLRRVRALRGIAGVKEIAPLADVLEATEDAARGLESHQESMSPDARQLLEAAAAHLRTLASALRSDGGGDVNAPSSSRDAFNTALEAWASRSGDRERVVPIADLFYPDGAPGVLEAAQNPPTSLAQRFRLELVSLGEHLRQVIDAARRATDNASTVRAKRDLRGALRALQASAASFGETEVATLVANHIDSANHVDFLGLSELDDLAAVLGDPGAGGDRLRARLGELVGGRTLATAIGDSFGSNAPVPAPIATPVAEPVTTPVAAPVAAIEAQPTHAHRAAPADSSSFALLDAGIAALESIDEMPFVARAAIPEEAVVPIESLLYHGRAALDRAVEIRDELKRAGSPHDQDALEELFDLVGLAQVQFAS